MRRRAYAEAHPRVPIHLMHMGEEFVFVLIPVAIIYGLVSIDRKRKERNLRQQLDLQRERLISATKSPKRDKQQPSE
ncbi:MAG TPA: hypothetical protein VND22_05300 [Actinomycetota bacterium]|nr:hypothetical protein [Actinomycetota bacterium]